MRHCGPRSGAFRAVWFVLGIALCASVLVWGARLERTFHSGTAIATPLPSATAIPGVVSAIPSIVTVNDGVAAGLPANLCVQLSPRVKLITVESVTGEVITTLRC